MKCRLGLCLFVLSVLVAHAQTVDDSFFLQRLYPILQAGNCRGCHVENGVATATRLHFPPDNASAEEIVAFGKGLAVLVDKSAPEKSMLFMKPTNRIVHTGGKLIPPGSQEESVLLRWITYLAANGAAMPHEPPAPQRAKAAAPAGIIRRLTHSQYNNTVRDLLGDQTFPASQFPPEDFVNGFKNQAEAQSIPPLLAEAYSNAAEKLAKNAFRAGDRNHLIPCSPKSAADADCRVKFLRDFGLKAFRRPLSDRELRRYEALFVEEARRNGQFLAGAQIVVEAMLQAPSFLFHVERGPEGKWEQYQTASRLSYFIWDTMPDAELFQAAAAGRLATSEQIERQARRMLEDARARQAVDEFTSQWLRFDRVWNTVKDRRTYQQYTPELGMAMTEETRRLIADAVWNDRNFMDVFTADYAFLNSDLADLYGVPKPAEEFGKVQFPPDSGRAGLVGEGTFLTLTSKPEETSPTARGLFVRENFLCQQVPNPPPGTNMNLPPLDESKPLTNKERLEMHRTNQVCKSCHSLIDPIGFGLEQYDGIGRFREKQELVFFPDREGEKRGKKPTKVQLSIDASGTIAGLPNSNFSSPKELGRVLANSTQCQDCVVKQLFRYAFGRQETPADRATIQKAAQRFRESQFRFRELIVALATSDQFRNERD
jgi:hypothetical protein